MTRISPEGVNDEIFCGSRRPGKGWPVACRRLAGHAGYHSAYTFAVSLPTVWPSRKAEKC